MEGHGAYSNTTSVQKALGESLLELTTIGSQEFYRCVVCDCSMAGDVPARSHLMGGPHMKALRNYFHKTVIGPSMVRNEVTSGSISSDSMTSVPLRVDHETLSRPKPTSYASSSVSVDQAIRCGDVTLETIGPVEYMNCNICNTSCTGTVSMEEHLSGAPHLKRIRKRNSSKMDANEFSPSSTVTPSTTVRSSGTGMPPQPQPTVSQYFNIGSDPVQDAIRDGIVVINPTVNAEQYTCQVCNIECTGEVPMNAHLNGKAHQKCLKRHQPSRTTSNASTLPDILAGNQCPISSSSMPTARRIISPRTSPSPSPSRQSRSSQHLPYSVPAYEIPQAVPSPSVKDNVMAAMDACIVIEVDESLMCLVCDILCTGYIPMADHLTSDHHRNRLRDQMNYEQFITPSSGPGISNNPSQVSESTNPSRTLNVRMPLRTSPIAPQRNTPDVSSDLDTSDDNLNGIVHSLHRTALSNTSPDISPSDNDSRRADIYLPDDSLDDFFVK